jgi:hypothetical protein
VPQAIAQICNGHNKDGRDEKEKAWGKKMAGVTGLEPATSGVTGQRSNQLSYTPNVLRINVIAEDVRCLRVISDQVKHINCTL